MTKSKKKKSIAQHTSRSENKELSTEITESQETIKLTKKQYISLSVFAVFLLLFLLTWKEPEIKISDDWNKSALKLDSATRVQDPVLKKKLIDESGTELINLSVKYPKHARVHFYLGFYYSLFGNWDLSVGHYKTCIQLDSGSTINSVWDDAEKNMASDYLKRVNVKLAAQEKNEAKLLLSRALADVPTSPKLCELMGHLMMEVNLLDSALLYYSRSLNANPNNGDVLNNVGVIYQRVNKFEIAAEYYRKSLQVNPNQQMASENLRAVTKLIKH